LYVVATPIGNLADISRRAIHILTTVDYVLAEDTRHSKRLLHHYGINSKLRSCHEHNEHSLVDWVKQTLNNGASVALISDAGTPLISDPGFVLVRALREDGFCVVAVPGPSAIIAALSIAGLPTDGFVYDGFLPNKRSARQAMLSSYQHERRTVVLLESSHRIEACLEDVASTLGGDRQVVLARELTKRFETVLSGTATDIQEQLKQDPDQTRGEFVLMLAGHTDEAEQDQDVDGLLRVLVDELPVKQAAGIAAKLTGLRKNDVYQQALKIKKERHG
jgi:16S rRNA (cytidine1402-2'-O)-methyltransferase